MTWAAAANRSGLNAESFTVPSSLNAAVRKKADIGDGMYVVKMAVARRRDSSLFTKNSLRNS
ncbi:hypothetical protein PBRA_001242 [Plasmodiophora brassicae]|uniref:Uncharacterized protein n=1 Tax=Plasmodiophora brassicae TaxID=37360 RepID=A0A0G4IW91_PLABS|nr:hypothetical protein PBRA_001242 [Plasmodiophora brassicae]